MYGMVGRALRVGAPFPSRNVMLEWMMQRPRKDTSMQCQARSILHLFFLQADPFSCVAKFETT